MSSSINFEMLASVRYPGSSQQMKRMREEYTKALEQCRANPAYHAILPTGDYWPCANEPFMSDDTKGWTTIKRKIRVKRIKSDEELDWEAGQMHDPWEAESVDSQSYVLPTGEHNGALFDIGARF